MKLNKKNERNRVYVLLWVEEKENEDHRENMQVYIISVYEQSLFFVWKETKLWVWSLLIHITYDIQ